MIPTTLVVQIDTREKKPLLFPATLEVWTGHRQKIVRVFIERVRLDAGDYCLKDQRGCIVERKGSLRELNTNLLNPVDSGRQARAFRRLSEACDHPYLLVHTTTSDLLARTEHNPEPGRLVQVMTRCLTKYGLSLLVAPRTSGAVAGRVLGTLILHIMVGHTNWDKEPLQ